MLSRNGWKTGIGWQGKEGEHWGLWSEGFNNYYADIRGTDKDIPILEYQDNLHDYRIIYQKGAVLALALDRFIQEESDGKYSLDDVLKYAWKKWDAEKIPFS